MGLSLESCMVWLGYGSNVSQHRKSINLYVAQSLNQAFGGGVNFLNALDESFPRCRPTVSMAFSAQSWYRRTIWQFACVQILEHCTQWQFDSNEPSHSIRKAKAVIKQRKDEAATAKSSAYAHGTGWRKCRPAGFLGMIASWSQRKMGVESHRK